MSEQRILPGLPQAIIREIGGLETDRLFSRCEELLPMMTGPWRTDEPRKFGDNWLVANFGADQEGREWLLTTDCVRASEYSGDARADAEFCAIARVLIPRLIARGASDGR